MDDEIILEQVKWWLSTNRRVVFVWWVVMGERLCAS